MSIATPNATWWSWEDIVKHSDRLGIPHFQRGAVWESGNRDALLESIYEQSPCGSFVLWEPEGDDSTKHGVPVRKFAEGAKPMWLVDGQQRTRALLDTFKQLLEEGQRPRGLRLVRAKELDALLSAAKDFADERVVPDSEDTVDDDGEVRDDPAAWLVLLPMLRGFEEIAKPFDSDGETETVRRGSAFRRLRPRYRPADVPKGRRQASPGIPKGCVPLAALVSPGSVFHHAHLRSEVRAALDSFQSDGAAIETAATLDTLLPWGPQFVTGYAFQRLAADSEAAKPMTWAHLYARRNEREVNARTDVLRSLFDDARMQRFERFAAMWTGGRFAIGRLPSDGDVSTAIDAYVRINRAGVRVQAEERALALLSRAHPTVLDDLASFMRRRDGWADDSDDDKRDPRSHLTHESDRQMGFAVWMSTVTRYTALALLGNTAIGWLGVAAIDKGTFAWRLDRVGQRESKNGRATWASPHYDSAQQLVAECTERASSALLLVDHVLSEKLYLDHRMARPSARALYPILDLFYRVPANILIALRGDPAFCAAVGRLLHWTLLAPYLAQDEAEELVAAVHGIDRADAQKKAGRVAPWGDASSNTATVRRELQAALGRYVTTLAELWGKKAKKSVGSTPYQALTALSSASFEALVEQSHSLQQPAVGWLYAIERRGGAHEFSWEAQAGGHKGHPGKVGVAAADGEVRQAAPLKRYEGREAGKFSPEKQHIVPFSIAKRIVKKGGTRATASPANAIGNLTWLSRRQNALDALSDKWAVMNETIDRDNLVARGMLARMEPDTERALDHYDALSRGIIAATDQKGYDGATLTQWQSTFERLCEAREKWMVAQMRAWLEDREERDALSPEAAEWLGETRSVSAQ